MSPRYRYLTTAEAAERLNVSRQTVSAWCRDGRLKAHRTDGGLKRAGEWRLKRSVVEAYQRKAARS